MSIDVEDLPAGVYDVFIGGVNRISFTAMNRGADNGNEIEFTNRQSDVSRDCSADAEGGKAFLGFDPSGLVVEIKQNGTTLLSGIVPIIDPNDPMANMNTKEFPKQNVELPMTPVDPTTESEAEISFKSSQKGADFEVRAKGLPAGDFDIIVNNTKVANFSVNAKGKGKVRFTSRVRNTMLSAKAQGNHLPLNFDPAGATIRIVQGATDFFTATLVADALPGVAGAGEIEANLAPTGAQAGGRGDLTYETSTNLTEFDVEIEGVTPGTYDVFVDGVSVGMIVAAPSSEGVTGEIVFSSNPLASDPNEVALTFDPFGKTIQIMQAGVVILGGDFPAAP